MCHIPMVGNQMCQMLRLNMPRKLDIKQHCVLSADRYAKKIRTCTN